MSQNPGADYPWDPAEQQRMREAGEEVPPPPEPPAVAPPGPGGGMQAARQTDVTTHFGAIGPVVANQNVRIGGLPAATVGDPQTCPMFDGPKAHTGGTITSGSSAVNIGNMPAARAGDDVQCAGPTGQIALGCPNVYIGNVRRTGGGGGGGGAAAPGGPGAAAPSATVEDVPADHVGPVQPEEDQPQEPTWIGIRLIDHDDQPVPNEGFQVTLEDGTVLSGTTDAEGYARFDGIQPSAGDVTFTNIPDRRRPSAAPAAEQEQHDEGNATDEEPRPAGGEELNPPAQGDAGSV